MLTQFIGAVLKVQESERADNKIIEVENCGASLSGVPIPMLTISDFNCLKPKTTILINGRVHPGETNASWALHGFIRFLLSRS